MRIGEGRFDVAHKTQKVFEVCGAFEAETLFGSGLKIAASMTLKTAVFAPMPSASVTMARA